MKRTSTAIAAFSILIGSSIFIGCASNDSALPASDRSSTAGGNGAFGENPADAGDYDSSGKSNVAESAASHRDTAGGNGAFGENPGASRRLPSGQSVEVIPFRS